MNSGKENLLDDRKNGGVQARPPKDIFNNILGQKQIF